MHFYVISLAFVWIRFCGIMVSYKAGVGRPRLLSIVRLALAQLLQAFFGLAAGVPSFPFFHSLFWFSAHLSVDSPETAHS